MNKAIITWFITISFVSLIIFFVAANWRDFANLQFTNYYLFLPLVVAVLANLYGTGMLMYTVLIPLKVKLNQQEVFGLSSLNRFGNYLMFGYAGIGIRAFYLKKKHKLHYSDFAPTFVASNVFLFLLSSFAGTLIILVTNPPGTQLLQNGILFVLFFLSGFVLGIVLLKNKIQNSKLPALLKKFVAGINLISRDKKVVLTGFVWALVMLLAFTAMTFLEFRLLNFNIGITAALFIAAVGSLNAILNITPAGIGINEGLIVVAATALGIPAAPALATTLIRRVAVFIIAFLLSAYFSPKLFNLKLTRLFSKASSAK